jgi:hypothetical protein
MFFLLGDVPACELLHQRCDEAQMRLEALICGLQDCTFRFVASTALRVMELELKTNSVKFRDKYYSVDVLFLY